jgi:hypothetical protein
MSKSLKTGTLIARVEAPTVLYRVTSSPAPGFARILPYQRSGKEHIIYSQGSRWIGDGSVWKPV